MDVAMVGPDCVFGAAAGFASGVALTDAVVLLPGKTFSLDAAHFRVAADRSASFRTLLARYDRTVRASPAIRGVQRIAPGRSAKSWRR